MKALFARFRVIWGEKWVRQFCDADTMELAMGEWSQSLSGLTGEQIKFGIEQARMHCEWPPSIAQFLSYCRGSWEHRSAAYRLHVPPALPKPKADAELVRGNLSAMRRALGRV